MSDLYDDAKPVRDATLLEMERVLKADPDAPSYIQDGYRLGIQMTALLMTAVAKKLNGKSGEIESEGMHDMLAIAIAQLVAYVATGFRPVRYGKPISPIANLDGFFQLLVHRAYEQTKAAQEGVQDFVIPFRLNNGVMEKVEFDFADLLKDKGA